MSFHRYAAVVRRLGIVTPLWKKHHSRFPCAMRKRRPRYRVRSGRGVKLGHGNVEALEEVMGCTRDEARAIFESEEPARVQFRPICDPREKSALER